MINVPEIFGSMVFNEKAMRANLPKDIYIQLKETITEGKPLDINISNIVANAMKDWAIKKGATHYTHWFQPMIGLTAEKHDSFISNYRGGKVIMEFSGKELIKGEPDASSFPSGGLRATFEARGYTAWDPTSYAFVKNNTLYIPTIFCSYSGEVLDKKAPLLRSIELINTHSLRILKLFGNYSIKRVTPTLGAEQEYFLVDKNMFNKRQDLVSCGRTLFGAKPPKGQDLEDHYFGALRPKVSKFMKDLDKELWKLGIPAKTKHNEVAPAQYEIAPLFTTANIATDHNQLIMEIIKNVAERHNLSCILHEKPFAGVNGSGKHNNWSLITNTGINLFEPGNSPYENAQFLLFLCAVIKGVDEYQDLLRASVASAGNDHRLGSNEAPPAIISIFLGDELTDILNAVENGVKYGNKEVMKIKIGVHTLPEFQKDNTDRNRTSPFAFTGNKFEFRMVGSSLSPACPNIMLNTIVAEELCKFADILENCDNFNETLNKLIVKTIKDHKRIIFNGNSYSDEWAKEAKRRRLYNLKTSADAIPQLIAEKNIYLFTKHNIYTKSEIMSRYNMLLQNYCRVISIEAKVMLEMTKKQIIPAVLKYIKEISETALTKKSLNSNFECYVEEDIVNNLSSLNFELYNEVKKLEDSLNETHKLIDLPARSIFYRDSIISKMNKVRKISDTLEKNTSKEVWPFPSYSDILFSI